MPPAIVIGLRLGLFNIWCRHQNPLRGRKKDGEGGWVSRLRSHLPVLMLEVRLALSQLLGGGVAKELGQLIQGLSLAGEDSRY